jgi:hypothetical protein
MRFYEFATTLKHIKPLTPPQARIYALKQQKQNVNKQLKAEKDRQKRQREQDKIRQAQQAIRKIK